MAQQEKEPTKKVYDLSLIPGTHFIEENLHELYSDI